VCVQRLHAIAAGGWGGIPGTDGTNSRDVALEHLLAWKCGFSKEVHKSWKIPGILRGF